MFIYRAQGLCDSQGAPRPGLPVPNSTHGPSGRKATVDLNLCHTELRIHVKIEVAVLDSPSLTALMVPVDVKQH